MQWVQSPPARAESTAATFLILHRYTLRHGTRYIRWISSVCVTRGAGVSGVYRGSSGQVVTRGSMRRSAHGHSCVQLYTVRQYCHPLQQRPVECFSSLLIHDSRSSARRRVSCREVPSQLTGAPQSIDWREAAGAQGLCRRGRNGAPPKVRRGAAVRCAARGVPHPRQSRLDCVWGGIRVGYVCQSSVICDSSSNVICDTVHIAFVTCDPRAL